jgi:hypothetical protein
LNDQEPIRLDAILVCRQHTHPTEVFDIHAVLARSMSFSKTLVSAGMEVSRGAFCHSGIADAYICVR